VRTIASLAILFSVALPAGVARAGDTEELDFGKSLIDGAQYDEAVTRFARLLDPRREPCSAVPQLTTDGCRLTDESASWRARSYYALALALLDRKGEAKTAFKELLKQNPTFSPSPAIFPQKTIDLFLEAKSEIERDLTAQALEDQKRKQEETEANQRFLEYVGQLEVAASSEVVVTERSRWLAAIPLGVGQFLNEDTGLGVMFLSLEVAAIGATIGTGVAHQLLGTCLVTDPTVWSSVCGAQPLTPSRDGAPGTGEQLEEQVAQLRVANIVSASLLGALVVAGIIEAQVSFDATVQSTRPRDLPPKPPAPKSLTVSGVPGAPEAIGLGVIGTF
jgi:tetratricopeptide (TPR) repeat protein